MKTSKIISAFAMLFFLLTISCEKEELSKQNSLTNINPVDLGTNSLPHTKKYNADVAAAYFSLLTDISKNTPYFNPQSIRILTYSGLALYESVVPGMPSYQSMYTYLNRENINSGKKKDYYWPACANAAISRIALKMIADYPQPADVEAIQRLYSQFNESFLSIITEDQLQLSNEFGEYVADIVYQWSKTDGTFNACPPYISDGGPENWVPTPPFFFPAAGVCQGSLRTFIPNIVTTALPSPPPAYSTDPASEFYKMNEQVYQRSFNLTAADQKNNEVWRDNFINYN
ncbi:MAG: hypothetical protein WCD31_12575, partial [Gillisia sp.]